MGQWAESSSLLGLFLLSWPRWFVSSAPMLQVMSPPSPIEKSQRGQGDIETLLQSHSPPHRPQLLTLRNGGGGQGVRAFRCYFEPHFKPCSWISTLPCPAGQGLCLPTQDQTRVGPGQNESVGPMFKN